MSDDYLKDILDEVKNTGKVTNKQRLQFIMLVSPDEMAGFGRFVVERGGNGDLGDCTMYVDSLIKQRMPPGFKFDYDIKYERKKAEAILRQAKIDKKRLQPDVH